MDKQIREIFDAIQTPERLKRSTKAYLRKTTCDYGRNLLMIRRRRSRLAAGLLSLALLVSGAGLWFWPAASIAVDINPSIELKVNVLDRVITLEGRNFDGVALAEEMDVAGMSYDDAVQRILLSSTLEPYLEQGNAITITVAGGGTEAHGEEILSRVLCRTYNIAAEENVYYCQVNWETVRAAREAELSIPRYLAWQRLLQTDPGITAEDVRQMSGEKIWELAQVKILDNPCAE